MNTQPLDPLHNVDMRPTYGPGFGSAEYVDAVRALQQAYRALRWRRERRRWKRLDVGQWPRHAPRVFMADVLDAACESKGLPVGSLEMVDVLHAEWCDAFATGDDARCNCGPDVLLRLTCAPD